jgi:integrase
MLSVEVSSSGLLSIHLHLASRKAHSGWHSVSGQRAMRKAREAVPGLPDDFRLHDTRHYLASTLIDKGTGLKVVHSQMRHASATTTLRVYAHLMEGAADNARAALKDEYRPRIERSADA